VCGIARISWTSVRLRVIWLAQAMRDPRAAREFLGWKLQVCQCNVRSWYHAAVRLAQVSRVLGSQTGLKHTYSCEADLGGERSPAFSDMSIEPSIFGAHVVPAWIRTCSPYGISDRSQPSLQMCHPGPLPSTRGYDSARECSNGRFAVQRGGSRLARLITSYG
jgi:hypothetical protein